MIPTIGLMIGLYILARYVEMAQKVGLIARIALTILSLITIFCIIDLLVSSTSSNLVSRDFRTLLNPLTTGRIDSANMTDSGDNKIDRAKWGEAKSAMTLISYCIRAYYDGKDCNTAVSPTLKNLVATTSLEGNFFTCECYTLRTASCTAGVVKFNILCTAATSKSSLKPTTPSAMSLIEDGNGAVFSDGTKP